DRDGPYFTEPPAVRPMATIQDILSEDLLLELVEYHPGRFPFLRFFLGISGYRALFELIHQRVALQFSVLAGIEGIAQLLGHLPFDIGDHLLIQLALNSFTLLDRKLRVKLPLKTAELFDFVVTEHQCFDHDVFGDFGCTRFDHHYGFVRACYDQVQLGRTSLFVSWVYYEPVVDQPYTDSGDRRLKRDVGQV